MTYTTDTRHKVELSKDEVAEVLRRHVAEEHGVTIPETANFWLNNHDSGGRASFVWNTGDES